MPKPESDARLFDVMYTCRAMRRLKPDPVPEDLLVQLVDAAIQGPSGTNSQNWRFVIVRDDAAMKRKIQEIWSRIGAFYEGTFGALPLRDAESPEARERQRAAGKHMIDHLHEAPAIFFVGTRQDPAIARLAAAPSTALAAASHFGIFGALKLLTDSTRSRTMQADGAAYPAVQNLLLAARALGLGAVLTTPHLFVPGAFEALLGFPSDFTLAAVVPVGFPKGRFGPIRRPDPRTVISWERFSG